MGYQEVLLSTKNFEKMIDAYIKLEKEGFYNDIFACEPRTVIQMKVTIGELKAGQKLLWVCGERCFLKLPNIFKDKLSPFVRVKFIDPEFIFASNCNALQGIDFNIYTPTENKYLKRWSVEHYAETEHKKAKYKFLLDR